MKLRCHGCLYCILTVDFKRSLKMYVRAMRFKYTTKGKRVHLLPLKIYGRKNILWNNSSNRLRGIFTFPVLFFIFLLCVVFWIFPCFFLGFLHQARIQNEESCREHFYEFLFIVCILLTWNFFKSFVPGATCI